jgi:hypothetical protein
MPFLRSFVETLTPVPTPLPLDEVADGGAQNTAPVVRDLDHVLDADPAETGNVDTRLDRDDRALGQHIVDSAGEPRTLVDLEAHPVTEAMGEAIAVAGVLDHRP